MKRGFPFETKQKVHFGTKIGIRLQKYDVLPCISQNKIRTRTKFEISTSGATIIYCSNLERKKQEKAPAEL